MSGTTAATMNVRIGADIAPLQQGLKQAQASVDQSAKLMGTSLSKTATSADGSRVATEFLNGLKTEFASANTKLKAALFQGQLTPQQFRTEGQKVAQEFNAGITQGLESFGGAGILTPGMEAKLVSSYKRAGLNAGDAIASGLTNSVVPATERAGREFGILGERGVKGGLMASVAMSQLALDLGSTESAAHKAVHGVSDMALMFGPEGLIVAGVLNAGLVLWQFFDKAKTEAETTAKTFRDSIASLVRSGDVVGLETKAQAVDLGDPFAGPGEGGGFKGGLRDLKARIATDEVALQAAISQHNVFTFNALNKSIAQLKQQAAPLQAQYDDLVARILHPPQIPSGSHAAPAIVISAKAPGASAGTGIAVDPITSLITQADTLLGLQKNVAAGGDPLVELNGRMLASLLNVNTALAAQADQYGAVALKLRDVQAGLLGANDAAARGLIGITPGAPVAPTGITTPTVIAGVPTQGKNIDLQNLPTIPSKLDTLGQIFKDAIASQATFIAQSLTTVLGIKQNNTGGAIGSVVGGALGAGLGKAAIGATAGAVMGSVVPVVGTVIGSVVGSFIGDAIGGLFGGHKKAVDNSATALNSLASAATKVSEALSNVPTGFKIALARYEATSGIQVPTYGGYGAPQPGQTPIVIQGDVHFHDVQDVDAMYDALTTHATIKGARGGTQPLSLALGVSGPRR